MKKYHRLEWENASLSMKMFVIAINTYILLWVFLAFWKMIAGVNEKDVSYANEATCLLRTPKDVANDNIMLIFSFFINWLHIDVLLLGYAIIVLKSSQDIL